LNAASSKWSATNLGILDAILVNVAYFLGFLVKFGTDIPQVNLNAFLRLSPWIGIMSVISFWLSGGYDDDFRWPVEIIYNATLSAFLTGIGGMAIAFLTREFAFPRTIFILGFMFHVLVLSSSRLLIMRLIPREGKVRKVAVIGSAAQNQVVAARISSLFGHSLQVTHMLDSTEAYNPEILNAVDIVCFGDSLPANVKEDVVRICLELGKDVYVVPDLYDILLHRARLGRLDDVMILRVESLSIDKGQQLVKRVFDAVLALALLVILSPLILVISSAIMLTSSGSPFYSQERIGWRGKPFKLLKFRTMIQDAERDTGPVLTWEGDPRITKVGRILRSLRLDELPQLINVLQGDMSFVGPRPERPFFVEQFNDRIRDYRYRLQVKPGITGLAQIEGRYSTNPEDKLKYDLYYIRSFSLLLDLQIILRTLKVAFTPDKANGLARPGGSAIVEEGAPTSDSVNSDCEDASYHS
jgi:exopolysaccharide biosynthesis polyprenyl glycosylphosphotransferase